MAIITVGIPVYNEADFLEATIKSVLEQHLADCTLLISDNCSTDNSWHIIQQYAQRDTRIQAVRQTVNIGMTDNFKYVRDNAKTPYFLWLGAHDLLLPNYLSQAVAILEELHGTIMAYPRTSFIDRQGGPLDDSAYVDEDIDTRGLSRIEKPLKVARHLHWCSSFHGVFRTDLIQHLPLEYIIGVDHLLLFAAAFHGDIVQLDEFGLQRRIVRIESDADCQERWQQVGVYVKQPALSPHSEMALKHFEYLWKVSNLSWSEKINLYRKLERIFRDRFRVRRRDVIRQKYPSMNRAYVTVAGWRNRIAGHLSGSRKSLAAPTIQPDAVRHTLLVHSIPKSGTNLLQNIALAIPGIQYSGDCSYAAERHELAERFHYVKNQLHGHRPGDLYSGHIPYSPEIAAWLEEQNIKSLFIYRDPRDVSVSLVHFVMKETQPRHDYYELYAGLGNNADRLLAVIEGLGEGRKLFRQSPVSIPNIKLYFDAYLGWLSDPNTFAVRYEDLIVDPARPSSQTRTIMEQMFAFLGIPCSEESLRSILLHGRDPGKSSTFRKGTSGNWRTEYQDYHIAAFKAIAGDLVERLGYSWE